MPEILLKVNSIDFLSFCPVFMEFANRLLRYLASTGGKKGGICLDSALFY